MAIFDVPNRVPQHQRAYQASPKPVWLRGARGSLYFNSYLVFWSFGVLGTGYGLTRLIAGKKD